MKLNIVLWALSLSTWFVSHLPRCVYQIIQKKKCGLCWLPNTVCLLHFSMLWAFHELNDNMIIRWFILVLNTWRYHEYDNLLNRVVKKNVWAGNDVRIHWSFHTVLHGLDYKLDGLLMLLLHLEMALFLGAGCWRANKVEYLFEVSLQSKM